MKRILVFTGWYPSPDRPADYTFVQQQVAILNDLLPEQTGEKWKFIVWNELYPTDLLNHTLRKKAQNYTWNDSAATIFIRQSVIISHRIEFDQTAIQLNDMKKKYPKVVETLGGTPDLVWCVTLTSASLWNRFMKKNNLHIPFFLQEHSVPLTMHLRHSWNRKDAMDMLRHVKNVVVVAGRQLPEFAELSKSCKPVVIWNAVSKDFLSSSERIEKSEDFVFLFVGRITQQKGVDRLVQATRILNEKRRNFIIRIVGEGADMESVQKYIRDNGISHRIDWLGIKTSAEISMLMDGSHAFVLPSLYENCPVALLEAQTKGVPSICTINGASEMVLLPGNGMVVDDDGSGSGLAVAMESMMEAYHTYDRNKIRERSLAEFSPSVFSQKMFDIFKSALA